MAEAFVMAIWVYAIILAVVGSIGKAAGFGESD